MAARRRAGAAAGPPRPVHAHGRPRCAALRSAAPATRRARAQVVLYALPELDGAVDTVVLGGLEGDEIKLEPERVAKLAARLRGWVRLRATPAAQRRLALLVYGFPPNVGATGTAVSKSEDKRARVSMWPHT